MLCIPKKRELPYINNGTDPPKLKSVLPLAETLMGKIKESLLPTKYTEIAIGTIVDIYSRLMGLSPNNHMIIREGIRPFFSDKQISKSNLFRAMMYIIANASELEQGNVVPNVNSGIPRNTELWQLIQTINVVNIANTEKGPLYAVTFLILTAPLAGSTFTCRISAKQLKRLVRDNSSCKYDPNVLPAFIFGYRLCALLKSTDRGLIIQSTHPQSSVVAYNVKIKKARLDCRKRIPCTKCPNGSDKCRYAVKQTSWPLVVCPYCLQDAYSTGIGTTCKCYKENYRDRE